MSWFYFAYRCRVGSEPFILRRNYLDDYNHVAGFQISPRIARTNSRTEERSVVIEFTYSFELDFYNINGFIRALKFRVFRTCDIVYQAKGSPNCFHRRFTPRKCSSMPDRPMPDTCCKHGFLQGDSPLAKYLYVAFIMVI